MDTYFIELHVVYCRCFPCQHYSRHLARPLCPLDWCTDHAPSTFWRSNLELLAAQTVRVSFLTFYRVMLCIAWTMLPQYVHVSVRPSVRPSVRHTPYCVETAKHILKLFHRRIATVDRMAVWLSGNALASINVVALRQTRLVPGWVIVYGRVNHLGM